VCVGGGEGVQTAQAEDRCQTNRLSPHLVGSVGGDAQDARHAPQVLAVLLGQLLLGGELGGGGGWLDVWAHGVRDEVAEDFGGGGAWWLVASTADCVV
jgi:hypothetical protein